MYNFAGLRAAHAAFWHAIAEQLRAEGLGDIPEELDFAAKPVPDMIGPDVLFTQTCGYPLQKSYAGQYQLLATPTYDAPGCGAGTHCAFIIVRADDPRQQVEDLAGARFAVNSLRSNSGMNLPRRLFAPLAKDGRFFSEVVMTGGHPASLDAIRAGTVDAASVDCLTWAYAGHHQSQLIQGLRVLAATPASPTIPFITSAAVSPELSSALQQALLIIGQDLAFASVRRPLLLTSINAPDPDAYARLLNYELDARALGYLDLN